MKTIEVAAALVFRDGKLLIAKRHPEAHLGGLWEFPGGKRDPEETFEECLMRELREELGIVVSVLEPVEDIVHEYPEKRVRLRFYRCRLEANEPKPLDCAAVEWVSPAELSVYEFPAADARLLEKLRANAGLWQ